uniref:Uncharacterized protein n=1 Tax=Ixodes ricinus TaxID=34613 RepID=A0A6B0UGV0_IXORI
MPALLMSTSSLASVSTMSRANLRTDLKDAKSKCLTTTLWPVSARISRAASLAFFKFRHARMTRALRRASSMAVSLPMPALPPVMMTVLPSICCVDRQTPLVYTVTAL